MVGYSNYREGGRVVSVGIIYNSKILELASWFMKRGLLGKVWKVIGR